MMKILVRLVATCAILLALACSAPAQQAAAGQSGSDIAAQVGDRAITVKEVDDRWRQAQPAEHAQAVQQIYDGRKQTLDAIVADMLIEQAAKAKGVNAAQFTEAELARRSKPVTDGQVAAFFQENQAQMQGRGIEAMSPAIRRYLEEQQRTTAYQALVAELRKAGPPVRQLLDAPRYQVDVSPDDPALGAANAAVTLVEFSDFQCPFCARVMPTLKRVHGAYGDRVRIVWKDFPLTSIHPQAFKAAEAGQCAREQGKFWEYHDRLFTNQQTLDPESLKKHAAESGLDAGKFNACLDAAKYGERVQEQMGVGARLGVSSTPTVFVNGRLVSGAQPYEVFTAIIDEELERAAIK
ncbi:MAG: thioredoxin domain-containing protein [Acidobacteria bacterium]|nr:thioredoxin domain-containing protein [Acidobacteriota bacterium]